MLNAYSPIASARFEKKTLVEMGYPVRKIESLVLAHSQLVELQAEARGEPTSPHIKKQICALLTRTIYRQSEDETTFTCTDGSYAVPYRPETLSRHFLYLQGFFLTHPGEPVPVPFTCSQLRRFFDCFFAGLRMPLTDALYMLQVLTPVNDMYYFMFPLCGMPNEQVLQLCEQVQPDSYATCRTTHYYQEALPPTDPRVPLLMTSYGGQYLSTAEGMNCLKDKPSLLFVISMVYCTHEEVARVILSNLGPNGFDDMYEWVKPGLEAEVQECLLNYVIRSGDLSTNRVVYSMVAGTYSGYLPFQIEFPVDRARGAKDSLLRCMTRDGMSDEEKAVILSL